MSPKLQQATGIYMQPPGKLALQLADRLEGLLVEQGWPGGQMLGPETSLGQMLHASPRTTRQAIRILESRQLLKSRRGCGGGLVVAEPSLKETGELMALHLLARGTAPEDIAEARRLLLAHPGERDADSEGVLALTLGLLDHVHAAASAAHRRIVIEGGTSQRAIAIVQHLLRTGIAGERSIGTIEQLCDRYDTSRPVIVQALRILEDLGFGAPARGRQGGFRLSTPSTGALVRSTHSHFVAQRLDLVRCAAIISRINDIHAERAAVMAERPLHLRALAGRFQLETMMDGDVSAQIALLREVATLADNQTLHLLVRCFWFYSYETQLRAEPLLSRPERRYAAPIVAATHAMAEGVVRGDPEAAGAAMRQCGTHLLALTRSIRAQIEAARC